MDNAQLINQDSQDYEYFTPIKIVDAARRVMGSIDLDPASCALANKKIKAGKIYTQRQDGLTRRWAGTVWLNHPFSRNNNIWWVKKIIDEYVSGDVEQACIITYANTSEKWFLPLMDYPQCFLSPRTHYYSARKKATTQGATKGSVVTYLGKRLHRFRREFDPEFGKVKV